MMRGRRQNAEEYNIARAILDGMEGGSGPELEVHRNLAEVYGDLQLRGIPVPPGALLPRGEGSRTVQASTGAGAVAIVDDPRGFVRALRRRSVLAALGATIIPDFLGHGGLVAIAEGVEAQWITEADLIETGLVNDDPDLRRIPLQLHIAGATTAISHQLLNVAQDNPDAEDLVKTELLDCVADAIDAAGLSGSGENGEPLGAINDPDIPLVAMGDPDGGPVTWERLTALELAAKETEPGPDARAWVTSPEVRKAMRTTERIAGSGSFLLEGHRAAGYDLRASDGVLSGFEKGEGEDLHGMIFGAWAEMLVATWGPVDLVVDRFSRSREGMVEITVFLYGDVARIHPAAFSRSRDIDLS